METRTRLMIARAKLPEPVDRSYGARRERRLHRQHRTAYVRERIAIEYQGSDHWTNPAVFAEDIERRILFECNVIPVIADHIFRNHGTTMERIRNAPVLIARTSRRFQQHHRHRAHRSFKITAAAIAKPPPTIDLVDVVTWRPCNPQRLPSRWTGVPDRGTSRMADGDAG
jgi:hypothetical protein